MFIKPAVQGLLVHDPITKRPLKNEGEHKSDTDFYWARRLAQGDVVLAEPHESAADHTGATQDQPSSVRE